MKYLFLGGSKHGEMIDVPNELHVVVVPKRLPFDWRLDATYPSLSAMPRDEEYIRRHQGLPSRLYDSVPVYLLRGADLADEFSLWIASTLNPEPDFEDLLREPGVSSETGIVAEVEPHMQVSEGERTIRWFVSRDTAVGILQALVQMWGPGKEVE